MSTIVTRAGKGSPLTNNEVDANFVNLNTDKIQTLTSTDASVTITGTGSSRDLSVSIAAAGDVDGPASATDNAVARYDGTTGKLIQNSVVTVDDLGNIAGAASLSNVDYVQVDTTGASAQGVAKLQWDDGNGTLEFGLKGGNVNLQVGQEIVAMCYNDSGVALTDGQIVYISGAQGNRIAVKLALATTDGTSAGTLGMVTEPIAIGAEGFITILGTVNGLNTTGLTAGALVYLSPTVAGAYTTTKPVAPQHTVTLGYVERVHATVGSIYVKVDNGYELDELHNVLITSPTGEYTQELAYQASTGVWKNYTKSTSTIAEGTNLYYTDARVRLAISGSAPLSYSSSTGVFSIPAATSSVNGYLTSTDWSTFNGKQDFLVSGTNIKTINGSSVLGSGDLVISGGDPAGTAVAMAIALG